MQDNQTLKVKWPFGNTVVASFIILIALYTLTETIARTTFIREHLPTPSIGTGHRKFDHKVFLLNNIIKEKGNVDCIFLGASDVAGGINPKLFNNVYRSITGKNITCFNFGIAGLSPKAAAMMTRILVKKYHPRLIVWAFNPTIFSSKFDKKVQLILASNPWCQYQLGSYNFEGWLSDHSYAYRYFLRFLIWLKQPEYSKQLSNYNRNTTELGFNKSKTIKMFKHNKKLKDRYSKLASDFKIEELGISLKEILRFHPKTEMVLVEMPPYPHHSSLYTENRSSYIEIISYIKNITMDKGVIFFPTAHLQLVPHEGFKNLSHMNKLGSQIFSRWLAIQLADASKQGNLKSLK